MVDEFGGLGACYLVVYNSTLITARGGWGVLLTCVEDGLDEPGADLVAVGPLVSGEVSEVRWVWWRGWWLTTGLVFEESWESDRCEVQLRPWWPFELVPPDRECF